jgi:hypothetical protein
MKQTSVEWLEEKLDNLLELYPSQNEELTKLIQQAKEMEEEQKGYSKEEVKTMLYNCVDVLEYNTKGFWNKDGLVNEIIENFKSE